MTTPSPRWYKSSYSSNGGDCIEVAANLLPVYGIVPIRDSKDTSGPVLDISATSFAAFVAGVKTEGFAG